jgi:hypothetical protein
MAAGGLLILPFGSGFDFLAPMGDLHLSVIALSLIMNGTGFGILGALMHKS